MDCMGIEKTACFSHGQSTSLDLRVAEMITLITTHYDQPWTIKVLASHVNLHPSRAGKLFKDATGTTPWAALKIQRLAAAAKLLETMFLSVKQVAAAVGFHDYSHFIRDFTEKYAKTPSDYRTAHPRAYL